MKKEQTGGAPGAWDFIAGQQSCESLSNLSIQLEIILLTCVFFAWAFWGRRFTIYKSGWYKFLAVSYHKPKGIWGSGGWLSAGRPLGLDDLVKEAASGISGKTEIFPVRLASRDRELDWEQVLIGAAWQQAGSRNQGKTAAWDWPWGWVMPVPSRI